MRFGAALSEHPLATQAVGETVGQILEDVGAAPDLVCVFVTAPHVGALEDIARAVRQLLNPRVLIGTTAVSVLGGSREVEESAAIAVFAARFELDVEPVRLEAIEAPDGTLLVTGGAALQRGTGTLLLLNDPFSFPIDRVLGQLRADVPGVQVIGGMASAARGPGGNVLVLDDELFRDGAVGVMLPPEVVVTPIVSQGCRPIGQPFVVTRAERNVIYELGGQPALDRLTTQLEQLADEDRRLLGNGLHIGIVIDEHRVEFGRGDFLVRGVVGADRTVGAVAVGEEIEVGTTVQFQVRDAGSADDDLWELLGQATDGARSGGALVFTCNGRGSHLFGTPDHDARAVSESLSGAPVAGMFCAGEIGPVGGRNFVHGFTASIALFGGRAEEGPGFRVPGAG